MINKGEKRALQSFERIKNPYWKIENWKDILQMAIPIFVQLAFNVIITQINIVAINYYQGGIYSDSVSKAVLTYTTLQFVPTLIASGSLVVCGNLIGQGRNNEISKVMVTGIIINFLITSVIFVLVEIFSDNILYLMNSSQATTMLPNGEMPQDFIRNYYRLLNLQLLVLAFCQVFISGLQAIKKNIHVTIGAVASNIVDLIFVVFVLFVFDLNPLWSALSIVVAGVFQLIYMVIMNIKFIDYKINKGHQINLKLVKETIKVGLPIALEMGVWSLCNFATGTVIAHLVPDGAGETGTSTWIVLHRSINSINQFSFAFMQAMGTVTAVMVSRKIGEDNIQGAYEAGINCWKTAMYASFGFGIFTISLAYPLLLLFNHDNAQIFPWGYTLMGIVAFKLIFDTVNMTLLRACWAVGDLWYPLLVSIVTMGIGMVALPFTIVYGFKTYEGVGLILIYIAVVLDPISRSFIYAYRWIKGTWTKYAAMIQ
ncbi:hypothetical protein ELUMI_v1c08260 [Williamsoniiplasma luminosum]|uniref:Probable multidrug resistance protein NorM n=1 Tax=Williamsoniiplasma luminosum TaxID=214888 RepID=A0A2K8NUV3_9MOLU|nr:MATE family efflux transporter [Williamsoniiplasma luminosum]ATZ17547.1 hypothetical protein ELUMI_v1c08260 [Williamsoniiplasma luminosum]